ncbi:hypothetical protein RM780_06190 [Streptomyces sp. DSM 44917]|uniref:PBS lyase n=1 Tax=Streptomyces boetiae TaxID=3075541 RepID=A0ABU2L4R1_9ACTN|nr:hypothetical protein [Streptomyces sp. DSM 44917]MDT0306549.1 hypothetical protein [Streptomyces sp. DSM 44917]
MTQASAERLLRDLDPLPHPRRARELAARARAAAGRGELRDLVEALARHGEHGRRLAALAAAVGRETGYLAALLTDPDPVVRRRAQRAARAAGVGDYALEVALEDAPRAVRRELLRTVVATRRTALADLLVDRHRARWGDAEAAPLLSACPPRTVARLLPALFPAIRGWRALATRHPDLVLDEAARRLAALPAAAHPGWWARHAPAVALAAGPRPGRALALLERHDPGPMPEPLWQVVPRLLTAEPGRTLRLLLAPARASRLAERGLPGETLRRLARRHPPELAELGRAWAGRPRRRAALLAALPPHRRAAFHDAVTGGADSDPAAGPAGPAPVADRILALLPHARRHAEARRLAERARSRGLGRYALLAALAHLPVAEAAAELRAATRGPLAEERADGWVLLIRNAARSADPVALTAVLAEAGRLRDEQDPVRAAALDALAAVPPRLFTDEAEPGLDRVAADAVAARDSSPRARAALSRLALAVLREHAVTDQRDLLGWSLRTLVRLTGHTGEADLGRLERTLRRGQEHDVFASLRPWLEAGAEKVDHGLTFALARAVGRRARGMPELQELLRQAIQFGSDQTVRTAAGLWLEDPATRDARVADLLALDPSAAALPPVTRVLTHRRTDLLDTLLGERPPYGRFLPREADPLPPLAASHRWQPRQRRAAARRCARLAESASTPGARRAAAVAGLAALGSEGAEELRRLAGEADTVVAEAALDALSRTERPGDALPGLLALAGGDRARVAVPAAARAARHVPPSRLGGLLTSVLLPAPGRAPAKVTARKAAVHLAAALLPVAEAAALLAETAGPSGPGPAVHPGVHPDVVAACVAAAPRLLGDERAWRLLGAATSGPPAARLALLRVRPLDLADAHRVRYAALPVALAADADPRTAAAAHAALAHWGVWAPEAAGVLVAAATDLAHDATWQSAVEALTALARTLPAARDALHTAVASLAVADAAEATPDAQAEADLPARRRIQVCAARLRTGVAQREPSSRPLAAGIGELLSHYPDFTREATELLAAATDLDAPALTADLTRLAALHRERPALAARTAEALARRLAAPDRPGDPAALLAAAGSLAAEGSLATGLFAVRLARACGTRTGWPAPWRDLLRALRRHPCADVRDEAHAQRTDLPARPAG